MTPEQIRELVESFATTYVKSKEECIKVLPRFINVDVTQMSSEDFKVLQIVSEQIYSNWLLLAQGVVKLPPDVKQAFEDEYKRLTAK